MTDQTKVIAGRDLLVYTAPWDSTNAVPPDTVAWGTTWGTPVGQANPYVEKGYTRDGLTFRMNVTRQNVAVDQTLDPVLRIPSGRDLEMRTRLAEIQAANIKQATGQGSITTVAAASGTRGHDDLDVTSLVTDQYVTVGFDIRAPGDLEAFRVIGWKGLPTGDVELAFNAQDAALLQFTVGLLPDTSTSPARMAKIRDVIAALP